MCSIEKNIDNFYKVNRKSAYYRGICKQCALIEKLKWKKTEKGKACSKRYNSHRDRIKSRMYTKNWKLKHPEEWRLLRAKTTAKRRRSLGFTILNKKSEGMVAHHLDNKYVMYIPEDLHRKCAYPDREIHRLLVLNELFIKNIIL